jgi:hypothetical protein
VERRVEHRDPALPYSQPVVVSVHTGINPSRPSRAGASAPEHWERISWRVGSRGERVDQRRVGHHLMVRIPLPTSTESDGLIMAS